MYNYSWYFTVENSNIPNDRFIVLCYGTGILLLFSLCEENVNMLEIYRYNKF